MVFQKRICEFRCRYVWLLLCICMLAVSACTPFSPSPRSEDELLPAAMPQAYPSDPQLFDRTNRNTYASRGVAWWKSFDNKDLDALITKSLKHNYDILTAWATLRQSQALTRQVTAGLAPTIGFDGNISQSNTSTQTTSQNKPTTVVTERYGFGFDLSYELDLWGRVASQREAELLRTKASEQDLQTAAMTVVAAVADTWVSLIGNRQDLAVLESQIATNEDLVELQTVRFNNGISTSLELLQQKELLASVLAELPSLEQEAVVLRNQLSILQGTLPGTGLNIDEKAPLPILKPMTEPGLPMELLDKRPDIKAAWARLIAADWDVSAAHANRYPNINFSVSRVLSAGNPTILLSNWVDSLVGALAFPIFDGGARYSEEARAKATADVQVQSYVKTVATAIEEVDNALAGDVGESAKLKRLEEQYVFAHAAMIEARNSYLGGVSTFLNYITELKNVQVLERTIARQKTSVLRARITLYRALGSLNFPVILQ